MWKYQCSGTIVSSKILRVKHVTPPATFQPHLLCPPRQERHKHIPHIHIPHNMLLYAFALIPFYILIWVPLSQMIFGRQALLDEPLDLNSTWIASDDPPSCPDDSYKTFIISREPLMIYVEGFLTEKESRHLVDAR